MESKDYEIIRKGESCKRQDTVWTEKGEPEIYHRMKAKVRDQIVITKSLQSMKLRVGDRGQVVAIMKRITRVKGKPYIDWIYKIRFEYRKMPLQLYAGKHWEVIK